MFKIIGVNAKTINDTYKSNCVLIFATYCPKRLKTKCPIEALGFCKFFCVVLPGRL